MVVVGERESERRGDADGAERGILCAPEQLDPGGGESIAGIRRRRWLLSRVLVGDFFYSLFYFYTAPVLMGFFWHFMWNNSFLAVSSLVVQVELVFFSINRLNKYTSRSNEQLRYDGALA
jgi:hypothetical protein